MTQVVQIPIESWQKIERILQRFDKEQRADKPKAEWMTAGRFRAANKLTAEQLRGVRERHPEFCKAKPGPNVQGRYLYNNTAYQRFYQTA